MMVDRCPEVNKIFILLTFIFSPYFYFVDFYIFAFLLRLHVPPGIVLPDNLV